jgi:hypothetical protein
MGEEGSPGTPATADGLGTTGNLNDAVMRESTERAAAADAAAKEEAIKVESEAAAREELRQERVRAEVEERRHAESQAHAARERMPRRMGALQVRGSQDDAEEIYWMLSEGEQPAEWGKVLYNDKTGMQSHRTTFRGWLVTNSVSVSFWAAVRNGWVKYGRACYRINAIGGDKPFEPSTSYKQGAQAWPPLPKQAAADTSGLRPGTTPAGRKENERTRGLMQQAAWLKEARQQQSGAEDLKAVLMAFKQEMKADMEQLFSARAAAPPAAAAAQEDGEASAQGLQAQLQQLQQTVAELKTSYKELQGHYHKAFAGKGAAEDNSKKLEAIVEVQAKRIRELEVQFHTPVKSFFAASTQGEPPSLASMPVIAGGMFSPLPGAPGVRTDRDQHRGRIWAPEGGKGAVLTFPPCVVGAPFLFGFNPIGPVYGVVPAAPVLVGSPGKQVAEAGGQEAGKEEAKGQEVRKDEEGGQPAAAVASVAAAVPVGAAGQGSVPVGSRRPPERPPGQGGTPDAKATRSDEPAGAASEGRPEWKKTGTGEWRVVGKKRHTGSRGRKPTIC